MIQCGYGGFHSHGGIPKAGWFVVKNRMNMDDDLGVPLFQETTIEWNISIYKLPKLSRGVYVEFMWR